MQINFWISGWQIQLLMWFIWLFWLSVCTVKQSLNTYLTFEFYIQCVLWDRRVCFLLEILHIFLKETVYLSRVVQKNVVWTEDQWCRVLYPVVVLRVKVISFYYFLVNILVRVYICDEKIQIGVVRKTICVSRGKCVKSRYLSWAFCSRIFLLMVMSSFLYRF